jgi:FlaG/FlaF family flagellin (archaellin)
MKLSSLFALVAMTATLAACGGGGGDSAPAPAPAPAADLSAYAGTYTSGCTVDSVVDSLLATVTVSANGDSSARIQTYTGLGCNSTALNFDIAAKGTTMLLAGTKTITTSTPRGKSGTAKTAEFTLNAVTLGKGSLGSLPMLGTKAKIGFLIEGSKVYVLSGTSEPDGLPSSFSTTTLTKQ